MSGGKSTAATPSSNWLKLQKKLGKLPQRSQERQTTESPTVTHPLRHRKRKLSRSSLSPEPGIVKEEVEILRASTSTRVTTILSEPDVRGESVDALRKMVAGELDLTPNQQSPGTYLAIDCEMVGVGIEGKESSLARVSIVNYHGAIVLDEFVRQRERVVDYRTQWSGVRERDLINAKPFAEIQKLVADLLNERILVGHAVQNDLQALLLSHPRPMLRDTQVLSAKSKVMKGSRPALRNLVLQELGLTIQSGEHSSVIDARATMAVFRLHRKAWEKLARPTSSAKRQKLPEADATSPAGDAGQSRVGFPGGGRKGVSSGLSVVVKRSRLEAKQNSQIKRKSSDRWWNELSTR
ncbi:ribonuclease H-like protein [Obba rivulosa]|uniref:RNA exonuclease 4 n=1 Tax=Obba rivulosa TaxID=1052685 RepID=A0A8E2AX33_9APHY|nr:ribonuclease H-like protein [Obba rivulosa]